MRVNFKAIGKEKQISNSQCICHICFPCTCENWCGKFWRMAHDSPVIFSLPKFSCVWYVVRVYGIKVLTFHIQAVELRHQEVNSQSHSASGEQDSVPKQ